MPMPLQNSDFKASEADPDKLGGSLLLSSVDGQQMQFGGGNKAAAPEPAMKETDSLLAKTLNQLSLEERNHALQDLHGVSEILEENPEFLEGCLRDLDLELEKIKSKKAYFIAKSISLNYVSNKNFRLQLLRAENFNAKDAAARIVRYFQTKMEIFGKEKLTQEIMLSDLPKQDLGHFRKGYLHMLSQRDRAGRKILFTIGALAATIPIDTRRRILWYILNNAAKDEEVQRKAIIVIYYGVGHRQYFVDKGPTVVSLLRAAPVRISAIHGCYDNPLLHPLMTAAAFVMGRDLLCRFRYHYGSHMECVYRLMTFGIPKKLLPFDAEGVLDATDVQKWLKIRIEEESTLPLSNRVVVPGSCDVLLGRGKRVQESPGNNRLRQLLESHRDLYESVSKFQKTLIAESILRLIKESGGRFLKQGDTGWTEVDDDMARKKISHAFRNLRSVSSSASATVSSKSQQSLKRTKEALVLSDDDLLGNRMASQLKRNRI